MNLWLSSGDFFSFFLQSFNLLHLPNMWPSYPTHFHGCAIPTDASILCDFRDLLSSFLYVGIATMSCFSRKTFFWVSKSQHSFCFTNPSHGTPHTFRNLFTQEGQGRLIWPHIFLAILHVLVWDLTHVSFFRLLSLKNFVIIVVSKPSNVSNVRCVHDQVSLSMEKTA